MWTKLCQRQTRRWDDLSVLLWTKLRITIGAYIILSHVSCERIAWWIGHTTESICFLGGGYFRDLEKVALSSIQEGRGELMPNNYLVNRRQVVTGFWKCRDHHHHVFMGKLLEADFCDKSNRVWGHDQNLYLLSQTQMQWIYYNLNIYDELCIRAVPYLWPYTKYTVINS